MATERKAALCVVVASALLSTVLTNDVALFVVVPLTAVSVGGFGFMVGSLANLIALRMSGDRRAWIEFHAWAVPFLGFAAAQGYALLFWLD